MKKNNKSTDFSTVLSSILILVLVVGVVALLFIRTDNFTTPPKKFYVSLGNDDFFSDRENLDIQYGKEYKFDITTNLNLNSSDSKYFVSIVPNKDADFVFRKDEDYNFKFSNIESLSKGFELVAYDTFFTLKPMIDLPEIIQSYYNDCFIGKVPSAINSNIPYFRLVISNADMTEKININFNLVSGSFKVVLNGNEITSSVLNYDIILGQTNRVDIHTDISSLITTKKYNLFIGPNEFLASDEEHEKYDFGYSYDENPHNWRDVGNLKNQLNVEQHDDYFTFVVDKDLPEILKEYHNATIIENVPSIINTGVPYLRLVIESVDSTQEIQIYFNIKSEQ